MNAMRKCRMLAGLSQRDVAKKMDVSPPTVSMWEHDKIKPLADKLVRLADLYGVTVDALLGRETE